MKGLEESLCLRAFGRVLLDSSRTMKVCDVPSVIAAIFKPLLHQKSPVRGARAPTPAVESPETEDVTVRSGSSAPPLTA